MKFKQVVELEETGWSDWIFPRPNKPYRMKCCDCGLVHDLEFQVGRVERRRGGWTVVKEVLGMDTHGVWFRARRNDKLSEKPE